MSNPRPVHVTPDDILWIFEAVREDPSTVNWASWCETNVFQKMSQCRRPRTAITGIIPGRMDSGNLAMQVVGICGTNAVIVSGVPGPVLEALLATNELPQDNFHAKLLEEEPLFDFWSQAETKILADTKGKVDIEFLFCPKEQQMYIHFDIGGDDIYRGTFVAAVNDDKIGFINWLITPNQIGRKVYEIDGNGGKVPISLRPNQIRFTIDFAKAYDLIQGAIACPPTCHPTACSLSAGTVNYYDPNGPTSVSMEVVLFKPYCEDNITNGPCTD